MLIGSAAAAAVVATQLYYVREMLAALILFAILFSCIAGVLLLLFILDRTGEAMLQFLGVRGRNMLQHARERRSLSDPGSRV
jgi:hypothetical protein